MSRGHKGSMQLQLTSALKIKTLQQKFNLTILRLKQATVGEVTI